MKAPLLTKLECNLLDALQSYTAIEARKEIDAKLKYEELLKKKGKKS